MSPQAQTELNRLEDSPAPRGAAYWQRRALAAEKRVKELEAKRADPHSGPCANCGGDYGLHHYLTNQCPFGGHEAPYPQVTEYMETRWQKS